jgi:predicted dehydrogenase
MGAVRQVKPRVGFAGLGWIGRHRLSAIAASGTVQVAALQDPSGEALSAVDAPGALRMTGFDELLRLRLDGIVIASPSALHADQSLAALASGAAVFCQKPLGRTAAETAGVVAAAREADLLLGVDLCYPRTAAFRAMRDARDAGGIGRLYAADFTFHNAYGPDKPWFYDLALSGGGALIDLGTHLVDLALDLFGTAPLRVAAELYAGGARLDAPGLEDYATATLGFPGGATARIACSWNLHAGRDAVIAVDLHGTEGGLSLRNVTGSFTDFEAHHHQGTATTRIAAPPDDWGGRTAVAWADALAAGRGFDPAAERLITLSETVDWLYRAGFDAGPRCLPPPASAAAARPRAEPRTRAGTSP